MSSVDPPLSLTVFLLRLPQSILLSDDTTDSDTDSDDSDFSLSREELHDMLRLHRFTRQHQSKFHSDREVRTHTHTHTHTCTRRLSNVCSIRVFLVISVCVYLFDSSTNISTTALDSSLATTPSTSNSATYWAQRRRKSKMRRNSRVKATTKRRDKSF